MSAQATTKLQVNYKLADGTLINVYADHQADLQDQLAGLVANAQAIADTARALTTGGAVATVTSILGAKPVDSAVVNTTVIPEGSCRHGVLVWRESKPGAPKAWKGWFCPAPKGTPDQCAPKFLKG